MDPPIRYAGHRMGSVMHRVVLVVGVSLGVGAAAHAPPAGLTGVATDEQGAPLSGVSVEVQLTKEGQGVSPAVTSEDGRFTLAGLDAGGELVLDLEAPDGRRRLVFAVDAPSSGLLDLGAIVLPQPARLEGRVVAPDGSAMPEAEVSLWTPGVTLDRTGGRLRGINGKEALQVGQCKTDADGRFACAVSPPGWTTIATLVQGHAPKIETVLLGAGLVTHVDVHPQPGFRVRGRVVAPDASQPISGKVSMRTSKSSFPVRDAIQTEWAVFDANGAWELADLPAGRWFVNPHVSGFRGKELKLDLPQSVDGPVDLPLVADAPESGSIEATVVDEQGRPLEAFTLWCASFWVAKSVPGGLSIPWSEWVPFSFGPDAAGRARLGPLEIGEYQLIATTEGRVSNTVKVSVRSEPASVEAKLSVEPAESLRVEVVDERTGRPLPGVALTVDLHSIAQPLEHRVETDATGTAVIGRLPRGPVDVRIVGRAGDKSETISVTLPHPDPVKLVGKALGVLHVRLSRAWRAAGAPGEWFDRSFVVLVSDAEALVGLARNVIEGATITLPPGQYHVDVTAFDPAALFGGVLPGVGSILSGVDVNLGEGPVTAVDF